MMIKDFHPGDAVKWGGYTAKVIFAGRNHGISDYEGYVLCEMNPPFLGWSSSESKLFPSCLERSRSLNNLQWLHPSRMELIGIDDGYDVDA